jgi:hypothetical protein
MKIVTKRSLIAGFLGGITLNLVMLLTFRLLGFGFDGNGILLEPSIQSSKLIAIGQKLNQYH